MAITLQSVIRSTSYLVLGWSFRGRGTERRYFRLRWRLAANLKYFLDQRTTKSCRQLNCADDVTCALWQFMQDSWLVVDALSLSLTHGQADSSSSSSEAGRWWRLLWQRLVVAALTMTEWQILHNTTDVITWRHAWRQLIVSLIAKRRPKMTSSASNYMTAWLRATMLCYIQLLVMITDGEALATSSDDAVECPSTCFCNALSRIVYCSRRGLEAVPTTLPRLTLQLNVNGNHFRSPILRRANFSASQAASNIEHLYLSDCGIEILEVCHYNFTYHHCTLTEVVWKTIHCRQQICNILRQKIVARTV